MGNEVDLLHDPAFQRLISRRSRWRWSFSALLIGAYLLWGIAGIYFPDQYARPFMGSSIPIGLAVGTLIIMMSIALSIVYVRIIDRIETEASVEKEKAT